MLRSASISWSCSSSDIDPPDEMPFPTPTPMDCAVLITGDKSACASVATSEFWVKRRWLQCPPSLRLRAGLPLNGWPLLVVDAPESNEGLRPAFQLRQICRMRSAVPAGM
eukprot:scaffold320293_cov30-Tisochrysis_lutea.AAC.1